MAAIADMPVIAGDSTWRFRCRYLLMKAAIAVMSEDPGTTNHANRVFFAKKVISGGVAVEEVAIAVLTNSTIAAATYPADAPDGDLEFTINSMFDAFADSAAV